MSTSNPLRRETLIATFHSYGRPRERWLVGAEFERHLIRDDGSVLPYHGPDGVGALLHALRSHWAHPIYEGEHLIALSGHSASITLEPGSQLELSGAPHHTLDAIEAEARDFSERVDALLAPGVHQLALGYTPVATLDDIPWAPKGRYVQMRDHLGRTGLLAHHMMKGTCATQASFDFSDEADCARKVRLACGLAPLTTALFANSPLTQGAPNGWASFRGHIWTQTDPARAGLPDAAHCFSFERWVDYLLNVPMMFKYVDGSYLPANGHSFADWLDTDALTMADWDLHQTTVFPEVRVKQQIEVRGADAVPLPLAMGFVALFKGLFYCDQAMDHVSEQVEDFVQHGTRASRFDVACRDGLRGQIGGRSLASWAEDVLTATSAGLQRCAPAELHWLDPLITQVASGESPADAVLRAWQADPRPASLFQRLHPLA